MSESREKPLPPGRLGLPWIGETIGFLKDPITFLDDRYRRHGAVFKTRLLGDNLLCFVGPEAVSFFYDERYFSRAGGSPPHFRALLHEDAVPFLDGAKHKLRKRLLLAAFTPDALAGYVTTIERVIARYLARWEKAGKVGLAAELQSMVFDIANALFAGADPDRSDEAMAAAFDRMSAGVLAPPIKLPFTSYGRAIKARDELRRYVQGAVAAHKAEGQPHVLARLAAARGPDGEQLSNDELWIELLHFFAAAVAGLSGCLNYLMMALAAEPEVLRRAREEVAAHAATGPLTAEAIGKLEHVARVTREVRRHSKLIPSSFFAVVRDDCEHAGFRLPKGWKALAVLWSTNHDAKAWTDPDRFDPDRFAPGRAEDQRAANAYVPQGGGEPDGHRCAGEWLTDVVLNGFTALLLRGHRWTLPEQDLSLKLGGLVPVPRGGLQVVFEQTS